MLFTGLPHSLGPIKKSPALRTCGVTRVPANLDTLPRATRLLRSEATLLELREVPGSELDLFIVTEYCCTVHNMLQSSLLHFSLDHNSHQIMVLAGRLVICYCCFIFALKIEQQINNNCKHSILRNKTQEPFLEAGCLEQVCMPVEKVERSCGGAISDPTCVHGVQLYVQ